MKIFITGASGFVGGAAAQFLKTEHEVFAMSRTEKSDAVINALGVTPVRCALNDIDSNTLAGHGCSCALRGFC